MSTSPERTPATVTRGWSRTTFATCLVLALVVLPAGGALMTILGWHPLVGIVAVALLGAVAMILGGRFRRSSEPIAGDPSIATGDIPCPWCDHPLRGTETRCPNCEREIDTETIGALHGMAAPTRSVHGRRRR